MVNTLLRITAIAALFARLRARDVPSSAPNKPDSRELPPPASGKVLAERLDEIASHLTTEDLEDLDRVIEKSRERAR